MGPLGASGPSEDFLPLPGPPFPLTEEAREGQGLPGSGRLASPAAISANDFPRFWLDNLIICLAFILSKVDDK